MRLMDQIALVWLVAMNAVAFVVFGLDKWLAKRGAGRVPEATLLWLCALGGWPGGLLAMQVFRHKTAKLSFKLWFALALVPFAVGVWAWWRWR
jgi:uncharacterized membrane protein YsdA (DUF1294 family)